MICPKMSHIQRKAYGVRLLGVRWANPWSAIPKARQRRYSMWIRRGK